MWDIDKLTIHKPYYGNDSGDEDGEEVADAIGGQIDPKDISYADEDQTIEISKGESPHRIVEVSFTVSLWAKYYGGSSSSTSSSTQLVFCSGEDYSVKLLDLNNLQVCM